MTKKRKLSAKTLSIENTGEKGAFGWQDAIVTYDGSKYRIAGHHDPQSVIASAFIDKGELLCTRKRDFGGCGKDAAKPEIVQFGTYIAECGEIIDE